MLDAVFADRTGRQRAVELARKLDVAFAGLWLTAPESVLINRVSGRELDASDADAFVVERQVALHSELDILVEEGWNEIDASRLPQDTLENAKSFIANTV